jgi:hypothetical protein
MNIKNSKKIVPATVFAAIIVLLAFAVMMMSTTASMTQDKLVTTLNPEKGHLGDVVKVTIDVNVDEKTQTVTVIDTLPADLTYIGDFTVNGDTATPDVAKQVISYNIENIEERTYKIEFNVKVTEANWANPNVENVVEGTWNYVDGSTDTEEVTAAFNIAEFKGLKEHLVDGTMKPEIEQEVSWKIEMGVKNIFDYTMTDTKITENFAGNLKIDSLTTATGNIYTFEYDETYGTKNAKVTITDPNGEQDTYDLDKDGVTTPQGNIYWTGNTHKAHFVWNIGNLASDNSKDITIGVSTDTNPAGTQLYTETGDHELNSGATLTFNDKDMMQLSAVAAPIEVTAVSAP